MNSKEHNRVVSIFSSGLYWKSSSFNHTIVIWFILPYSRDHESFSTWSFVIVCHFPGCPSPHTPNQSQIGPAMSYGTTEFVATLIGDWSRRTRPILSNLLSAPCGPDVRDIGAYNTTDKYKWREVDHGWTLRDRTFFIRLSHCVTFNRDSYCLSRDQSRSVSDRPVNLSKMAWHIRGD